MFLLATALAVSPWAPGTYRSLTDPAQHECVMEVLEEVRLPKHTCLPKPMGL